MFLRRADALRPELEEKEGEYRHEDERYREGGNRFKEGDEEITEIVYDDISIRE